MVAEQRNDAQGALEAKIRVFEHSIVKGHEFGFAPGFIAQLEASLKGLKAELKNAEQYIGKPYDSREKRIETAI